MSKRKKPSGTSKLGRPQKTLADLPENWQEDVLRAGREGYADIEIRVGVLGISTSLWTRFMEEEPDFSQTIQRAREAAQVWWLKHSRKELHNKEFNNKLYELNMQNRYGWNKKTESKNDNSHRFYFEDGDKAE